MVLLRQAELGEGKSRKASASVRMRIRISSLVRERTPRGTRQGKKFSGVDILGMCGGV
jgi:hypothetical protein